MLLDTVLASDSLTKNNIVASKALLKNTQNSYVTENYLDGELLVNKGVSVSDFSHDKELTYAKVPLGIILRGVVVVKLDNGGVKSLQPGDFIGLFETSDWIINNQTRNVGDWSLFASGEVEILFFKEGLLASKTEDASEFRDYVVSLARADSVPKSLSKLPLLDWVANHTTRERLSDCAVIVHTHVLPTSITLFRHLAHLAGIKNVFLVDKSYSTVRESLNEMLRGGIEVLPVFVEKSVPYESSQKKAVDFMWRRFIEAHKKVKFKKLVIVDDGADVLLTIPWQDLEGVEVVGVEQTQRGITRMNGSSIKIPPVVAVASSGIKKIVESPFIGSAVVEKLNSIGVLDGDVIVGVIGAGSIGIAVMNALQKKGKNYIFYDISETISRNNEKLRSSVDTLVQESDIVIGTTGIDSIRGVVLDRVRGKKVFVSASSSDVEFRSILQQTDVPENPFGEIEVKVHDALKITVLNGGYPINFDRQKEWESPGNIVLTRCLLYIGVMQSLQIFGDKNQEDKAGFYALDKVSQTKLLEEWLQNKGVEAPKLNVEDVINSTFLEKAKEIDTVWTD